MIVTHNGVFHCDEVLACYMLKKTEKYKRATIVRTRDQSVIDSGDVVVDVGGVYDPTQNRFDHHQRDFGETFSDEYDIKLSSAGLVYKHFGREVVQRVSCLTKDHPDLEEIYQRVYKKFILPIDAIDNGVSMYDGDTRYVVHTDLSSRISNLNPDWNALEFTNADDWFSLAMGTAGLEFDAQVRWYTNTWLPARHIVQTAFKTRKDRNMVLPRSCPWSSHLRDIEGDNEEVLYVIWMDATSHTYRIRAVAKSPGSFDTRKPLPESWRAKKGDDLDAVTGVKGCVFVHASGFIGGHQTLGGAIRMAMLSTVA